MKSTFHPSVSIAGSRSVCSAAFAPVDWWVGIEGLGFGLGVWGLGCGVWG